VARPRQGDPRNGMNLYGRTEAGFARLSPADGAFSLFADIADRSDHGFEAAPDLCLGKIVSELREQLSHVGQVCNNGLSDRQHRRSILDPTLASVRGHHSGTSVPP
jgi:hypothetical protein